MAIKKVLDLSADTTIGFDTEGQQVEGYYIGSRSVTLKNGPSILHFFQGPDGNFGVWGSAQLNAKLKTVPAGAYTYVTYLKKIPCAKGTLKTFDVAFDDEVSIDVSSITTNFSQEPTVESDSDTTDTESRDADPEETEEEEEAPPVQAAPAPKKGTPTQITPEMKAKATAMLKKAQGSKGATAKA